MSHFVSLLENALKAGDVADPAFRESVYKGALRAFDKMSNERPDRAEFRKVHGPQLAKAITRVEQKYVVLDDEDSVDPADNHQMEHADGDAPLVFEGGEEPAVADIDDDIFLDREQRPLVSKGNVAGISRPMLILGLCLAAMFLVLLGWIFI